MLAWDYSIFSRAEDLRRQGRKEELRKLVKSMDQYRVMEACFGWGVGLLFTVFFCLTHPFFFIVGGPIIILILGTWRESYKNPYWQNYFFPEESTKRRKNVK